MKCSSIVAMLSAAGWAVLCGTGCRQAQLIFQSPTMTAGGQSRDSTPDVRLASYAEPPTPEAKKNDAPPKVTAEEKKKPEPVTGDVKPKAPVVAAYTAPGAAYQQLSIAAVSSIVGVVPTSNNAGKEASESLVFSGQGTAGRLGVITTATTTDGGIAGRDGLQDGPGIGPASSNNIFNAQVNRLSGPTGRCGELAGAGFFGGSRPQCEVSFRRTR